MRGARNIIRQGLFAGLAFSLLLALIGILIAPHLPVWLGADEEIHEGASEYFTIVAVALPVLEINMLAAGSLRCSGNVKIPSFLNAMMCLLNVRDPLSMPSRSIQQEKPRRSSSPLIGFTAARSRRL